MTKEKEIIHDDTRNTFLQIIQWYTQNYASSHTADSAVVQAEKTLIATQTHTIRIPNYPCISSRLNMLSQPPVTHIRQPSHGHQYHDALRVPQ
jgi:hypothetical protein